AKKIRALRECIFETPRVRSRNAIGISKTRRFLQAGTIASNAILNPVALGAGSSKSVLGMANNPHIESCTLVIGNAKADATRDVVRRHKGQPGVAPPFT